MKTFTWTFKLNEMFEKETYDGTMHEVKMQNNTQERTFINKLCFFVD